MDYFGNRSFIPAPTGIQSTAGAVPVKNDKGSVSMKKVKVQRYVSGKRPKYAPPSNIYSDEDSEDDDFLKPNHTVVYREDLQEVQETDDPRLLRLKKLDRESDSDDEVGHKQRHVQEPEILTAHEEPRRKIKIESSESSEEELSDDEIDRRREDLKKRILSRTRDNEVIIKEEEIKEEKTDTESDEYSSEYEEYTDSEEETGPRLKPVFVKQEHRITTMEKEKNLLKQKEVEAEEKKLMDERRKQSFKMVEALVKRDNQLKGVKLEAEGKLDDVNTDDDENDELDYEAWKLRALKRMKQEKEEREAREKEKLELERLRNMTEEQRLEEARMNPKIVTNRADKGKHKFLQKYYHRGAYYLDKDDPVFKRDCSGPTLEDHFNKSVLPKVMQVKNFGKSGRSKYTHLVDQDTTDLTSPWAKNSKSRSSKRDD